MPEEPKKKPYTGDRPRIVGFNDLRQNEDDNNGNSFYAGGEKSGMAIEGSGKPEHEVIKKIFHQAQRIPINDDGDFDEDEEDNGKVKAFQGKAQTISGASASSSFQTNAQPQPASHGQRVERVKRTLTFWKDGFTVSDSGPLYEYTMEENQQLLAMLQEGQAPVELLGVVPGQAVDLRVDHRMGEQFTPIVKENETSAGGFQGKGNRLGDTAEIPKSPIQDVVHENIQECQVDSSKPVTNLQIRYGDGTKSTLKLNTTTTIAELHHSLGGNRPFILLAGRPPVALQASDTRTLQEASLLNTVVIQQYQ